MFLLLAPNDQRHQEKYQAKSCLQTKQITKQEDRLPQSFEDPQDRCKSISTDFITELPLTKGSMMQLTSLSRDSLRELTKSHHAPTTRSNTLLTYSCETFTANMAYRKSITKLRSRESQRVVGGIMPGMLLVVLSAVLWQLRLTDDLGHGVEVVEDCCYCGREGATVAAS